MTLVKVGEVIHFCLKFFLVIFLFQDLVSKERLQEPNEDPVGFEELLNNASFVYEEAEVNSIVTTTIEPHNYVQLEIDAETSKAIEDVLGKDFELDVWKESSLMEKLDHAPNEKMVATPIKRGNIEDLREAGRRMGGVTPKTGPRKWGREAYFNFSLVLHMWAEKEKFPLAEKPLTVAEIENVLRYGGPQGLNLIKDGHSAKKIFKMRYLNGAKRTERFVGHFVGGMTGEDGCHHYPADCPFLHCSAVSEWFRTENFHNSAGESISQLVMSPNSPRDLKILLRKAQEENSAIMEKLRKLEAPKESKENVDRSQTESFTCHVCGKTGFSRPCSLKRHIRTFHKGTETDNLPKEKKINCLHCGKLITARFMKIHAIRCDKNKEKLNDIPEENLTNMGSAGFCEECNSFQTVLKRHQILVHHFSPCKTCKNNLGAPCLSCSSAACLKCSKSPPFCPRCTIMCDEDGKKVNSSIHDEDFTSTTSQSESLCAKCKRVLGKPCISCSETSCKFCSLIEGWCKKCTITANSSHSSDDAVEVGQDHPEDEKSTGCESLIGGLNSEEMKNFERLLSVNQKISDSVERSLEAKQLDLAEEKELIDLMFKYHKQDLTTGRDTETVKNYVAKIPVAFAWLLKKYELS